MEFKLIYSNKSHIYKFNINYIEIFFNSLFLNINSIKRKNTSLSDPFLSFIFNKKLIFEYFEEFLKHDYISSKNDIYLLLESIYSKLYMNMDNSNNIYKIINNNSINLYNNINLPLIYFISPLLFNTLYNNVESLKHVVRNLSTRVNEINSMFRKVENYYKYIKKYNPEDLNHYKHIKELSYEDTIDYIQKSDDGYRQKYNICEINYKIYYKLISHPKFTLFFYKQGIIPYKGYFNSNIEDIDVFYNMNNKYILKLLYFGVNTKYLHVSFERYVYGSYSNKINQKFDNMENKYFNKILYQLNYSQFEQSFIKRFKLKISNKLSNKEEINKIFNFIDNYK